MTDMYDGFGNSDSDEVSKIHTIFTLRVGFLRNKLVFSREKQLDRIFYPLLYTGLFPWYFLNTLLE